MEKNPQFTFEVSVSKDYYLKKPSGVDYARMRWMKKTVTLSHFISLVMGGHSYCHIYFNNLRRKDKFMHTNIVSIDVDDTDICIADFVRSIQLNRPLHTRRSQTARTAHSLIGLFMSLRSQ